MVRPPGALRQEREMISEGRVYPCPECGLLMLEGETDCSECGRESDCFIRMETFFSHVQRLVQPWMWCHLREQAARLAVELKETTMPRELQEIAKVLIQVSSAGTFSTDQVRSELHGPTGPGPGVIVLDHSPEVGPEVEKLQQLETLVKDLLDHSDGYPSAIEIYHDYDGEIWEQKVRKLLGLEDECPGKEPH